MPRRLAIASSPAARWIAAAVAALSLAVAPPRVRGAPQPAERERARLLLSEGAALYEAGEFGAALERFRAAIAA